MSRTCPKPGHEKGMRVRRNGAVFCVMCHSARMRETKQTRDQAHSIAQSDAALEALVQAESAMSFDKPKAKAAALAILDEVKLTRRQKYAKERRVKEKRSKR